LLLPFFMAFRRIVACGEASRESLPRLYRRLARRPVVGIPNGVDLERVDRIAKGCPPRASDAPFTVISLGRLIEVKNPFSILEAFRAGAGPDDRLLMLGIGGLRDELQRACRADGIADRVEFLGLLPREAAFEQLNRADLFISTSRHEGVPVAVLEAMASRRPVVLSDIAPHREIVGDSNFVRLVPPDDPAGFAKEIARIAAMSAGERDELGERCRALVEERFGLAAMHQRYGEVYRSALAMGGI
jgi:glycosyltransferase involved in cell wall biosynthesis